MRIYTRGGDKGKTRLFDNSTVAKGDPRVEVYGTVDELNANLSVARLAGGSDEVTTRIERIQNELFVVGADFATPKGVEAKRVTAGMVETLENDIDRFMDEVGNPGGFVLPGDSPEAAALHVCRTVCRRAERAAASLLAAELANAEALVYLNRLSDLLYAMAVWTDKIAKGGKLRNPTY